MQQEAAEEEKEKRYENEYETARREALERMKAEEERRQLVGKLQADALRQQMEELKVKEMEVRASPGRQGLLARSSLLLGHGRLKSCTKQRSYPGGDSKKGNNAGFSF